MEKYLKIKRIKLQNYEKKITRIKLQNYEKV